MISEEPIASPTVQFLVAGQEKRPEEVKVRKQSKNSPKALHEKASTSMLFYARIPPITTAQI
jgi:hypothetical protein